MAVSATLLAVGTPAPRSALAQQRLHTGVSDVTRALSEARREAFRTSTMARAELDPADGRISVFVIDAHVKAEVERTRYYLPAGRDPGGHCQHADGPHGLGAGYRADDRNLTCAPVLLYSCQCVALSGAGAEA